MKYFFPLSIIILFCFACSDDNADNSSETNYISASIDSVEWISAETFTRKERGENGPLTIVGEGEGYTLELILGGISETGTYEMGTSRTAYIRLGNTTYSTLDVQDAGTITITRFGNNEVEGQFEFDAQWLSANNRLKVREGKFKVFYY